MAENDRLEFLGQLAIFADLDDDELAALDDICLEYEFEAGAVIAYQRDIAHSLYIVRSGRLYAKAVDDRGAVRGSKSYEAGDYFEDIWLFTQDTHLMTVKGSDRGRLVVIETEAFLQYLDNYPRVLDKLAPGYDEADRHIVGLSEAAWEEANKGRVAADRPKAAISLLPDELVEYQARRSRWYLFLRLVGGIFLLMLLLLLVLVVLGQPGYAVFSWRTSLIIAGIVFLLFSLYALYRFLDWLNDFFVITNKHLAHREYHLGGFRSTLIKVPIGKIQSVEVARPNLWSTLFNIGTARITTASSVGVVYFDNIDNPSVVRDTLNELSRRVKELDAGRVQASLRASVESHFQVGPDYQPVAADADGQDGAATGGAAGTVSVWESLSDRYRWRVVQGDTITYRRNFFVLLLDIMWPSILLFFVLLGGAFMVSRVGFTLVVAWLIYFLLLMANLAWFIWQFENWRNDIFQVSDRFVVDIDRRPFGFGESRKQAALSNIQNVNAERPGLLPTIFNYGNVTIETAGADADIVFEDVPRPSDIQSDIFQRLDLFQQRQREKEGEERRREYAVLLDVYQQAREQERIPRRTPPAESTDLGST